MKQRPLFWKLFPSVCMMILVSVSALAFIAYRPINQFLIEKISTDLEAKLQLAWKLVYNEREASSVFEQGQWEKLVQIAKQTQTRYTIINESGLVTHDSIANIGELDNHIDRTEILEALDSGRGESIRFSNTLQKDLIYKALAFEDSSGKKWVIRASVSLDEVHKEMNTVYIKVAVGGLLLLLAVGVLSFILSRRLSRPMEEMKIQAERIARGDFSGRVNLNPHDTYEAHKLGQAMNEISVQLDHRIVTILNQKNERDAILSSMVEGVVAVDPSEKVVHINKAAEEIFHVSREIAINRSIQEAIRIPKIQQVVSEALVRDLPEKHYLEVEINGANKVLEVQSSPLRSAKSKKLGAVFVISDVTKLKSLERHRSEFVANVSHELRTPLTSIQGFSETLLNSDVDKEQQRKFLEIIYRHARRLGEIIEDLLALSRLEREQDEIELQEKDVWPSLEAAKEICDVKAANHGVVVQLGEKQTIMAPINPPLLEQAIVNLIDNAIKYSKKGQAVELNLSNGGQNVVIEVRDHGTGIAREHLPRLFERFYRIDKARSRQLGGTGLGLSIVKHVALAHKGRVEVESVLGKGSKFCLILPKIHGLI